MAAGEEGRPHRRTMLVAGVVVWAACVGGTAVWLAALTVVCKGLGPALPRVPDWLTRRTIGLGAHPPPFSPFWLADRRL